MKDITLPPQLIGLFIFVASLVGFVTLQVSGADGAGVCSQGLMLGAGMAGAGTLATIKQTPKE